MFKHLSRGNDYRYEKRSQQRDHPKYVGGEVFDVVIRQERRLKPIIVEFAMARRQSEFGAIIQHSFQSDVLRLQSLVFFAKRFCTDVIERGVKTN